MGSWGSERVSAQWRNWNVNPDICDSNAWVLSREVMTLSPWDLPWVQIEDTSDLRNEKAPADLERCKGLSHTWQSEPIHCKFKESHWGQTSWKHAWVDQGVWKENECHKIVCILSMVLSLRAFFLRGLLGNEQGNFSFPSFWLPWEGPTKHCGAVSGRTWKRTGCIYNANDLSACHEALLLLLLCCYRA